MYADTISAAIIAPVFTMRLFLLTFSSIRRFLPSFPSFLLVSLAFFRAYLRGTYLPGLSGNLTFAPSPERSPCHSDTHPSIHSPTHSHARSKLSLTFSDTHSQHMYRHAYTLFYLLTFNWRRNWSDSHFHSILLHSIQIHLLVFTFIS